MMLLCIVLAVYVPVHVTPECGQVFTFKNVTHLGESPVLRYKVKQVQMSLLFFHVYSIFHFYTQCSGVSVWSMRLLRACPTPRISSILAVQVLHIRL